MAGSVPCATRVRAPNELHCRHVRDVALRFIAPRRVRWRIGVRIINTHAKRYGCKHAYRYSSFFFFFHPKYKVVFFSFDKHGQ
jgi:hypothetical protein